jgi:hypothetical protein
MPLSETAEMFGLAWERFNWPTNDLIDKIGLKLLTSGTSIPDALSGYQAGSLAELAGEGQCSSTSVSDHARFEAKSDL